jgi:phosphatidylglycerophosphatase A
MQMKKDWMFLTLASVFGLGYLPGAPGTFGSVAGVPLWAAARSLPFQPWGYIAATAVMVGIAIWIAEKAERIYGEHDVQHIVIDETAGLMVTAIGVPFRWPEMLIAFVLFRLFDTVKPWPVGWADRRVPGGFGVVLDDVLAGLMGCALMHVSHFYWGEWL